MRFLYYTVFSLLCCGLLSSPNFLFANHSLSIIPLLEEDQIDLELRFMADNPAFPKFKAETATLVLENKGDITATSIEVALPLPTDFVVIVGGTIAETSMGAYNSFTGVWTIAALGAGERASLDVQLFPLSDDYVPYAQVIAVDQEDADSSPNNGDGTSAREDDEANSTMREEESDCSFLDSIELPADLCARCLEEIALFTWNDKLYYAEIAGSVRGCNDIITRVLDCEGVEICRDGGFLGSTECERMNFFEEAVKTEVLASCRSGATVDLALSINTDKEAIRQWESGNFSLSISNNGTSKATGVQVELLLDPETVVIVGGTQARTTNGNYNNGIWEGISIEAGGKVALEVQLFSKITTLQFFAQVTALDQNDVDSSPNNGRCCTATEDDEAVFRSLNGRRSNLVSSTPKVATQVYPNPVQELLHIQTGAEQLAYEILDLTGKTVKAGQLTYSNTLSLSNLAKGVYILKMDGQSPQRLVKQ